MNRKLPFIAVLSFLVFVLTTCQAKYKKYSCMPGHHKEMVARFEAEEPVSGRIIFLGNSISEMGNWQKLLDDTTVLNRGIGGDMTGGILRRLDEIILRKPAGIFLMIGINDIGEGIPVKEITANIREIVRRIQNESSGTKIFLQSLLPVNPGLKDFPGNYGKPGKIRELNLKLKGLAYEASVTYVDLYPLFADPEGNLGVKYTTDGLHLNEEGYVVWGDYLKSQGLLLQAKL